MIYPYVQIKCYTSLIENPLTFTSDAHFSGSQTFLIDMYNYKNLF